MTAGGVNNTSFAGAISGAGSFIKTGAGTLSFTGTNSYLGATTIAAGTLEFGNGGASGLVTGGIIDNATLAIDRSDTVAFGNAISGSGTFQQLGAGTTILTCKRCIRGSHDHQRRDSSTRQWRYRWLDSRGGNRQRHVRGGSLEIRSPWRAPSLAADNFGRLAPVPPS